MIIDFIENIKFYSCISDEIGVALEYLVDCPQNPTGRFWLAPSVSAAISIYTTVSEYERQWEAHDYLIDIHYVKAGSERIRWANRRELRYTGREEGKDILRFSGNGTDFLLQEGMFCILFPEDAHMTKLSVKEEQKVTKAILKISI